MNIKTHRLDSKNQISKAALGLFIKKGIKATTTREIAKKVGIAEEQFTGTSRVRMI